MPEMKPATETRQALVVAFEQERARLANLLQSEEAMRAWGETALAAFKNPTVARSTPESVMAAVYKAARMRLPIDGVHFSLVPFFSKKLNAYEVVGIVGYQGWVSMYTRHAGVTHVRAKLAFEGEKFDVYEGSKPRIEHAPSRQVNHVDPTKIVAAYAVAHLKGGGETFVVMWRDELETLMNRCLAKAGDRPTPWKTDPAEMMRKSPIIRLRKGLTLTEDVAKMLAEEEREELVTTIDTTGETVREVRTEEDLIAARSGPLSAEAEPVTEERVAAQPADSETLRAVVRDVKGIPVHLEETWQELADKPIGGHDDVLAGMTPAEVVEAIKKGDPNVKARVAHRLAQARDIYANSKLPERRFQILALAVEQSELSDTF